MWINDTLDRIGDPVQDTSIKTIARIAGVYSIFSVVGPSGEMTWLTLSSFANDKERVKNGLSEIN